MSRTKPALARLCEMQPEQVADFFVLLAERKRGVTQGGKPYYLCKFSDDGRAATFMVWADGGHFEDCETQWKAGAFYKIRGFYHESEHYGPQIEIQQIRPVKEADREEGFDPALLVEHSRGDGEVMLANLRMLATEHLADAALRRLVLTIVERHAEALKRLPASRDKFYPIAGGLLEHTLSVAEISLYLVRTYAERYAGVRPPLNRDLVLAGAILHDMGRLLEWSPETVPPEPTVPGQLMGHVVLGRDLVRDTARELGDVNPEMLQLLEHVILTHLELPAWGSPRLPMVPEALIVHHADDLDAKLEMYARCLTRDREPGPFTARDPALGKRLLKGRMV